MAQYMVDATKYEVIQFDGQSRKAEFLFSNGKGFESIGVWSDLVVIGHKSPKIDIKGTASNQENKQCIALGCKRSNMS